MPLFDKTIDTLSRSLDLHLMRHSVISDNIANAETPGYKAKRLDFEAELQKAVEANEMSPGSRDIASVNPVIYEDFQAETGQDLNGVDMDREMAALTKNDIQYSAATQAVSKKFSLLKYAIGSDER